MSVVESKRKNNLGPLVGIAAAAAIVGAGALGYTIRQGDEARDAALPALGISRNIQSPTESTPQITPDTHVLVPNAQPTVIAQETPKTTQIPEIKPDVQCPILPAEFCSTGDRIIVDIEGKKYTYLAFKLPLGTPVYSPINGSMAGGKDNGYPFSGFLLSIRDESSGSSSRKLASFRGALTVPGDVFYGDAIVGKPIATVGEVGGVDEYNLAFIISTATPDGFNYDILKQISPEAFLKPPKIIQQEHPGKATSVVVPSN